MADFGILCGEIGVIEKVNLNGNTPSNGEIWSVWDNADPNKTTRRCITIQDSTATTTEQTPFLVSEYTDCYDCMSNNYYIVSVRNCIGGSGYAIPIYEFGFLPVVGETYYFEITNVRNSQFFSCFTVDGIKALPKSFFDESIAGNKFQFINGTPSSLSYETCDSCLSGNSITYEVARCTDDTVDYVPLINDSFINHLISYSDGVDEYCGVVKTINPQVTTFVFINDYGLTEAAGGSAVCDDCLATENQKILLQSCTDTEYTEVVWASTLFDSGDISNLSTDSGCFEVVGLTENDVTINNYLNFDPQPGCEPCIECNGINYSYTTCSEISGFSYNGLIDFGASNEIPIDVEYNPDTQHMYTTNLSTKIIVSDPSTNSVYTQYTIPGISTGNILYYDTNTMYVTNTSQTLILKLDTSIDISGTTTQYNIGSTSLGLAKDLPNNRLFITCSDYTVKIFDTLTNTVTGSISTSSGYYEKYITYDPNNDEIYTTASGYYSVEVYNPNTLSTVSSIYVAGAFDITYEPNIGNIYVTCSGYNEVKVIDTTTKTVTNTIVTPSFAGRIKYNSIDGYVYVSLPEGLLAIDPATNNIVALQTGITPSTTAFGGIDFYDVNNDTYLGFDSNDSSNDGLRYFSLSSVSPQTGDFKSYQYLPTGTKFYNPAIDECCEVTGTASSYYDTLYSVETFTDCTDCENNVDVVIWNASACTNSNTYSSFYVTTDSTAQAGDTVKLMWGSNEWICAGLINTTSSYSGYYTYYNTQKNGLGSTLIYDSCENCNSQGLIGVTLVNCDSGVESFVSITLDNYLSIYNFGSISNYSVKDSNGSCYQISNLCPIPLEEQDFTPVEFYLSCIFCEPFEPNTPRSANTETYICNYCCDCGASGETITQIVPPHPIWSDGYGTWVTQMNMVLIGSGNGLNA